ncbi:MULTISPECIES: nitrile hydratase accessory protein [Falsihalocynthiibacter]|uniref:nitrile hydratase accessory protein n=1 Tax=Falsihalocynthiibacter TaxID=2854182 RepID=UPI003002392F
MSACAPNAPPTPEATFEAPWHGQVFALTVALNESGVFAWPEWAQMFGARLALAGAAHPLDGSDDYYRVWVATLEEMVVAKGMFAPDALEGMRALWTDAFLSTPHGQPVSPKKPE